VPRLKPGLAFWLVYDLGFAVGLMTHHLPRTGHLVWIAEPIFDEEPTIEDVQRIDRWRWAILFPLGAAIHRKVVTPIGVLPIPPALESLPPMRSGNKKAGWRAFVFTDDGESRQLGPASDPSLQIYQIVNDTALKEMLVTGWRPEQDW
jgi:hypothetical protein